MGLARTHPHPSSQSNQNYSSDPWPLTREKFCGFVHGEGDRIPPQSFSPVVSFLRYPNLVSMHALQLNFTTSL